MAGIMNKIGETLHIGGGNKEEDKHKSVEHKKAEEHKKVGGHSGEHKEGIVEKIKDKIHGGSESGEHGKDGEKKKKKKKEKKKDGDHHGGSSSSSDSD